MPTRKAWDNADYEGKALRKVFTRLQKRFMREDNDPEADIEYLLKIAHMLSLVAKSKQELAKYSIQDKKIQAIQDYINSKKLNITVETGDLPNAIT